MKRLITAVDMSETFDVTPRSTLSKTINRSASLQQNTQAVSVCWEIYVKTIGRCVD